VPVRVGQTEKERERERERERFVLIINLIIVYDHNTHVPPRYQRYIHCSTHTALCCDDDDEFK